MHEHHHDESHICPRTGKCCGRCKLATLGSLPSQIENQERAEIRVPVLDPSIHPEELVIR